MRCRGSARARLAVLALCAVVCALLCGAKPGFAQPSSGNQAAPPQMTARDARVQSAFEALRAVGEASNAGAGGEEALRQACGFAQQGGSLALNALMDRAGIAPEASAGYLSGLGAQLSAQGRSGLEGALSSACLALAGQEAGTAGSLFDPDQLKRMGIAMALDESEAMLRDLAAPYVKRFEIETGYDDGEFTWQALGVVPLWKDAAGRDHLFTQISMNRHTEEGDTYNAGLAWRRLNESKTVVFGLNSFFDHAAKHNHNRMSVGADIQTSMLGVSANRYVPLSDWKNLDDYWEERAASGWDVELQGRVPELPSWEARVKGYGWSGNEKGLSEDIRGYDAAVQWTPINILQVEAGVRDEQSADPAVHGSLRLAYKFGDAIGPAFDAPHRLASVEERVYDKVRRENRIRTERRVRDAAYVSVIETAGANSAATQFGASALAVGQQLPRPFTVTISAAGGSVARLRFRDGAILTIGAGSEVRIEANLITLIAGQFQYVSGSSNIIINVPGGTITLHGTDVDTSTDGANSVLRVRDGGATLAGTVAGSATLAAGEAAETNGGTVGALAPNDAAFISHADTISTTIDRAASPQTGDKVAPYNTEAPRLTATATTPGQTITIGLKFNTAITASGGPPRLTLAIGGNTRQATLSGGSGTDDLAFDYTLLPGDAGSSTITVQALDLNGGTLTGNNGKAAVATMADTVLNLAGAIDDVTAPDGYAVAFTTDPIDGDNEGAAAFQITGAEIGATYEYSIISSGGGTPVTGTGTIASATQTISSIDVSGLSDGTLTLSLTLTDDAANTGAAATDTVEKSVIALALNFVEGEYELAGTSYATPADIPGWTFTRASPATTYAENEDGTLVAFAANTPRITDKGLLIEGSRTNLQKSSVDLTDAGVWLLANTSVAQSGTSPAGGPAFLLTEDTSLGGHYMVAVNGQAAGVASGTTYTFSFYAKPNGRTRIRNFIASFNSLTVFLDLASQTVVSQSGGTSPVISFHEMANGWVRVSLTDTASATSQFRPTIDLVSTGTTVSYSGDGASGVYLWGYQVEQASFASSYIPTTTAAVTRSADSASISTGGFPYSDMSGTLFVHSQQDNLSPGTTTLLQIDSGGTVDRISLASPQLLVSLSGVAQAQIVSTNTIAEETAAVAWANNDFAYAKNGNLIGTDASGNIPEGLTTFRLMNNTSSSNSGYIKSFSYIPSRLSNAQLQALTAP